MNFTYQYITGQVDWERREANASFANPAQVMSLANRCNRKIISTPGIKTVPDTQLIPFTGNGDYALVSDFIGDIDLVAGGAGTLNTTKFVYLPPDEFDTLVRGYAYTYKVQGKISIFATDMSVLPTSTLTLNYWSKNIILDGDGVTKKVLWEGANDKSRLPEEFDNIFIEFIVARILKRDGKQEWKDSWAEFLQILEDLKTRGGVPKPNRPKRAFGHFQMN